jgi:FkbM family methyltransferase
MRKEVELLYKLLITTPEIAVDIGGNLGDYSATLREKSSNLKIYIFEPSATNLKKLNDRYKSDSLIDVYPYAISNFTGSSTLHTNELGSGLASLSKRRLDHFELTMDITESIEVIRFEDFWIQQMNSKNIDIVKIDIEGHELEALKGFGRAINNIRAIQFEFGGCNIDSKTYFQDFYYFFKKNNYLIYRITPIGLEKIKLYKEELEFFSTTNYIAINKSKLSNN